MEHETYPVIRFTVNGTDRDSARLEDMPYTLVYDGACRVCRRIVRVLHEWDRERRICMVPSQTPGVHAKFPWIPERAYAESIQLIGPGDRTWQGAEAMEQIFHILRRGHLVAWVFRLPFARSAAERFYRWFARNRYKLGCGKHCQYRPFDLNYGDPS